MALRDKLDATILRSLKYGDNSPYVTVDINTQKVNSDVGNIPVVNNGSKVNSAIIDTARISSFLLDKPQWSLEQVGLQLMNIKPNFGYIDGTPYRLPTSFQLYTPLNTLAQVAATGVGGHIERQGLVPGNIMSNLIGTDTYEGIKKNEKNVDFKGNNNPLIQFKNKLIKTNEIKTSFSTTGTLLSNILSLFKNPNEPIYLYFGGPGGVTTTIRRYYNSTDSVGQSNLNGFNILSTPEGDKINFNRILYKGASVEANKIYDQPDIFFNDKNIGNSPNYLNQQQSLIPSLPNSPLLFNIFTSASGQTVLDNGYIKYNGNSSTYVTTPNNNLITYNNGNTTISFKSPDVGWYGISREIRIGSGKKDSINLTPLFTTDNDKPTTDRIKIDSLNYNIRDLVKFRIEAIQTDTLQSTWMVFRAYLTDFSDQVTAEWDGNRYIGKGEKFYTYKGHDRTINIGFKVAALSAEEMEPMYQKLNYLMSNMMGDYDNNGIMRGPFSKMTVGNWIDRQPGIITSLAYKISNDSPWEIAMDESENGSSINQLILPHVIEVSLSFTPIGVQTKRINQLPKRTANQSNIAQNENDYQFITGSDIPNTESSFEPFNIYNAHNLDRFVPISTLPISSPQQLSVTQPTVILPEQRVIPNF